jgi:hypothetical protein
MSHEIRMDLEYSHHLSQMAYWINFELMEELKHFLNKMVLLILFHLNIKQFVHVSSDLHSNSQKLPYKP